MKKLALFLTCFLLVFTACAQKPTADMVVQKMVTAMGGAENLAAINTQTWKCDFTMHVMPPEAQNMPEEAAMTEETEEMETSEAMGPHAMPMTITYKRPNKLRFDTMNQDGNVVWTQCYNGTEGWFEQMGQKMPMNDAQLAEFKAMAETWVDGLANYKDMGYEIKLLPDEMVDGESCYVLETTGPTAKSQILYINKNTNLPVKQIGEMTNMQGEWEKMVMTFKDYEMLNGIAVAQNIALHQEDGTLLWESAATDVVVNEDIEDNVFEPKEMTSMKE